MTEQERFEAWYENFAGMQGNREQLDDFWRLARSEDGKGYEDHLIKVLGCWEAWQAAQQKEGYVLVPVEPTNAMLVAARDWSVKKYGQAVGNDGASGCYKAMIQAAQEPT